MNIMPIQSSTTEVVPVPDELHQWASSGPQIQAILLKVKEQAGVHRVLPTKDNNKFSVLVDSPNTDRADIARKLLEMHFKQQIKLLNGEKRLQQTHSSLLEVQGEMAAGTRIEFKVPLDLLGVIIGKKGARVKEVQTQTGVNAINIDGESGIISVAGPDAASVQKARELLDIIEEGLEISSEAVDWLSRESSNILDLKETSGVLIARLDRTGQRVQVVGTHAAVNSAKLVLGTQLEYMEAQLSLRKNEREVWEQMQILKRKFGPPTRGEGRSEGRGGRGGRGQGHDDERHDRQERLAGQDSSARSTQRERSSSAAKAPAPAPVPAKSAAPSKAPQTTANGKDDKGMDLRTALGIGRTVTTVESSKQPTSTKSGTQKSLEGGKGSGSMLASAEAAMQMLLDKRKQDELRAASGDARNAAPPSDQTQAKPDAPPPPPPAAAAKSSSSKPSRGAAPTNQRRPAATPTAATAKQSAPASTSADQAQESDDVPLAKREPSSRSRRRSGGVPGGVAEAAALLSTATLEDPNADQFSRKPAAAKAKPPISPPPGLPAATPQL